MITVNFKEKAFQGNGSLYKILDGAYADYKSNLEAEEQCKSKFWTTKETKGGLVILDNENEMEVVSICTSVLSSAP